MQTTINTSPKLYYIQYNIGRAKYVVNYHNGEKAHKDGSPFYDIGIYHNKKQFNAFIKKLELDGYNYR